ncbi:MAG: ParA family partition ATPase [Thalassobaculaceae bacterium]
MPKIFTFAQQKGGAGKSTAAAQVAVALAQGGRRVGLIDSDPQGSLAAWWALRATAAQAVPLTFEQTAGWRLATRVEALAAHTDVVIIDTPPHIETDAKLAVRLADWVIMPLQPSPLDLWACRPTLDLAAGEGRAAALLLNRVPARAKLVEETAAAAAQLPARILSARLGNRTGFAGAMARGLGVSEAAPRTLAADEVVALAIELDHLPV